MNLLQSVRRTHRSRTCVKIGQLACLHLRCRWTNKPFCLALSMKRILLHRRMFGCGRCAQQSYPVRVCLGWAFARLCVFKFIDSIFECLLNSGAAPAASSMLDHAVLGPLPLTAGAGIGPGFEELLLLLLLEFIPAICTRRQTLSP